MKRITLKLKVIALLTVAALLLPGFTGAAASDETNPSEWLQEQIAREEAIGTLEAPATRAHKEIKLSWTDESGDVIYPDTFGGFHLNDDFKLLIWLVGDDPILKQQILDVVTDDSVLVFKNATASWNELRALKDSLSLGPEMSDLSKNLREQFYFYSIGVSPKYNAVNIHVLADPDTAAALVMYNAAYPNIRIVPHAPIEPEEDVQPPTLSGMVTAAADAVKAAAVYAGNMMLNIYGEGGTIGWFGTYDLDGNGTKENCILTAGHVVEALVADGKDVKCGITTLLTGSEISNSSNYEYVYLNQDETPLGAGVSSGDYGFLSNLRASPSNQAIIGITGSGSYELRTISRCLSDVYDLSGKTVFKSYGKTGYRAGNIEEVGAVFDLNQGEDGVINDCVSLSNPQTQFADHGDSGCTIYYLDDSNRPTLCGVFSGNNSRTQLYYFTPITIITGAGFTPYLG